MKNKIVSIISVLSFLLMLFLFILSCTFLFEDYYFLNGFDGLKPIVEVWHIFRLTVWVIWVILLMAFLFIVPITISNNFKSRKD